MLAKPDKLWNAIGFLASCLLFVGLLTLSPDPAKKEAQIYCAVSNDPVTTLPDMATCTAETSRVIEWRECACVRPLRYWLYAYYWLALPTLFVLLALALLRGPVFWQLLTVESSLILGGIVTVIIRNARGYTDWEEHFGTLGYTVI